MFGLIDIWLQIFSATWNTRVLQTWFLFLYFVDFFRIFLSFCYQFPNLFFFYINLPKQSLYFVNNHIFTRIWHQWCHWWRHNIMAVLTYVNIFFIFRFVINRTIFLPISFENDNFLLSYEALSYRSTRPPLSPLILKKAQSW